MTKKRIKRKVSMGATLSSSHGPKSNNKKYATLKKKKNYSNAKNIGPAIVIRGQDLDNVDSVLKFLEQSGMTVSAYKHGYMIRRTRARIARIGLNTYREYLQYLKQHPKEIGELMFALSINVTRFFRNEDTFDFIRDEVLPSLLGQANKRSEIRIWSAGCAVGAEPYSLSILCRNKAYLGYKIKILATDINRDLLDVAKKGVYSSQYLAEMTETEAKKFFFLDIDENYQIKPSLKKMVSFNYLDLTKDRYPTKCDLIICRNVLIYIEIAMQEEIFDKFYDALRTGGILVLGRTEGLRGTWRKKFSALSSKHRVYIKI